MVRDMQDMQGMIESNLGNSQGRRNGDRKPPPHERHGISTKMVWEVQINMLLSPPFFLPHVSFMAQRGPSTSVGPWEGEPPPFNPRKLPHLGWGAKEVSHTIVQRKILLGHKNNKYRNLVKKGIPSNLSKPSLHCLLRGWWRNYLTLLFHLHFYQDLSSLVNGASVKSYMKKNIVRTQK